MNPGSFFREVLESHEFQLSDNLSSESGGEIELLPSITFCV